MRERGEAKKRKNETEKEKIKICVKVRRHGVRRHGNQGQTCSDVFGLFLCSTDRSDRIPVPAVPAPVWFGSDSSAGGFSAWVLG